MKMTPYKIRNKYAAILAAQPMTEQYIEELDKIYNEYIKEAKQEGWGSEWLCILWENICNTANNIRRN